MKFSTVATIVTATVGLAAAQPHGHSHQHFHKRQPQQVVTVYELNGKTVSAHEVEEGVKNGTLVLSGGGSVVHNPTPPSPAGPPAPSVSVEVKKVPDSDDDDHGVNIDFPDGQLPCSQFPSHYGAVDLDYLGLDGWSGIQQPSLVGGAFDDIKTVTNLICSELSGNCCGEGAFCSYACPAGFQKSQWPLTQGATGQSVGGLECKNGKLYLTNPQLSKKLCIKGTDKVKVLVKNTMSEVSSICRTDYPGTEGETIPVSATPGSIKPLACPDAENYYHWQGASTSAQYYVNPAGIPTKKACRWGNPSNPWGNFAPVNLGVGYSNGAAWLSIFQNLPTTNQTLDYDIELVGNNGGFDNMIGRCKYTNGQYCTGDDYQDCSADGKGCTVNVGSGTATFVLTAR